MCSFIVFRVVQALGGGADFDAGEAMEGVVEEVDALLKVVS